jgi:thioredoxin-related protein
LGYVEPGRVSVFEVLADGRHEFDNGKTGNIRFVFDPKGQLAEQYELEGMPMTYLFDRVGKQVGSHVGYVEAQAAEREAEIAKLLREGK